MMSVRIGDGWQTCRRADARGVQELREPHLRRTARPCGSATSTSRPTRRGAAPTPCPGYERRLADVNWAHGTLDRAADPARAARARRRVGGRRARRGRGHHQRRRAGDPRRGPGRAEARRPFWRRSAAASAIASDGVSALSSADAAVALSRARPGCDALARGRPPSERRSPAPQPPTEARRSGATAASPSSTSTVRARQPGLDPARRRRDRGCVAATRAAIPYEPHRHAHRRPVVHRELDEALRRLEVSEPGDEPRSAR